MSDAAPEPPRAPLATGPLGMELLSFHREPEDTAFDDAPVGYALVVLRHEDRTLLVLVRGRGCWELPGGGIEPGETARQAAVRELREEAGQRLPAADLRLTGFARTRLPDQSVQYGALFAAQVRTPAPFEPNDEVSEIRWWAEGEPLPGGELQTVDAYLIALCEQ